jgi:hypothetical protein
MDKEYTLYPEISEEWANQLALLCNFPLNYTTTKVQYANHHYWLVAHPPNKVETVYLSQYVDEYNKEIHRLGYSEKLNTIYVLRPNSFLPSLYKGVTSRQY